MITDLLGGGHQASLRVMKASKNRLVAPMPCLGLAPLLLGISLGSVAAVGAEARAPAGGAV